MSLILADARRIPLADQCVQCVVTSPPYFGLRDYGTTGQIGLEATPDAYVASLVGVFREVRRVLADDGVLWLNLGDSYAGSWGNQGRKETRGTQRPINGPMMQRLRAEPALHHVECDMGDDCLCGMAEGGIYPDRQTHTGSWVNDHPTLKAKDLIGIPWRVAFALQADGWYLRSDVIWSKPNPMPESVTDRPTKAHEYLFLLTKNERYYYDADAIREDCTVDMQLRSSRGHTRGANGKLDASRQDAESLRGDHAKAISADGRNCRSVWTVATMPYAGAHFATMPEKLVEPCILAGSRLGGKRCDCDVVIDTPLGSGVIDDPSMTVGRAGMSRPRRPDEGRRPITRREQRDYAMQMRESAFRAEMEAATGQPFAHYIRTDVSGARPLPPDLLERWLACGWLREPAPCGHPESPADIVFDPFVGSGTVGAVAERLGRRWVGTDLNPAYHQLAKRRTAQRGIMFDEGVA